MSYIKSRAKIFFCDISKINMRAVCYLETLGCDHPLNERRVPE